jgi:peptidoglycan/LPS O-acetylase OafA/YrhL
MTAEANSKESPHIPELDGIRGVAILVVLLFHFFYSAVDVAPGGLAWHLIAPLRIGWTGVDLFFVLSGFLIGGILLDARSSPNFFKVFYTRRAFRILPLYLAVVFTCVVQMAILARGFAPQFSWMLQGHLPWFSYVFFVQNFWMAAKNTFGTWGLGGTWSLAIEEQFYLTLPLLIWLFEPKKLQKILIAVFFAAPILRTFLYLVWPEKFMATYALMPCRADALALGVLAAIAMRTPSYWTWIEAHGRLIVGTIFVLLIGCAFSVHLCPRPDSLPMRTFGYSWMALLYSLVIVYSLSRRSSMLSAVLRAGWLRALGKIAYGVYLLHANVLTLLTALISPNHPFYESWPALNSWFQLGVTIGALALTFGLCYLSFRFFEKPLLQIGHRAKYEKAKALEAIA